MGKRKKDNSSSSENSIVDKNIEDIVEAITKQFGKGSVFVPNGNNIEDIPVIPTGSPSLDNALGVGGYPVGRIVEIFGAESSGKTTLAVLAAIQVQKQGGVAAYIDAEHALDIRHLKDLGCDVNKLLISQPDSAEDALDLIDFYVRNGYVSLVILDSVAALVPKEELEGTIGEGQLGHIARMMSQTMRKIKGEASKSNTACIFINQTRQKIGVKWGNPETTTGGTALKFYSTVRIKVDRGESIKSGEEIIGNILKIKVVKNKVAPPFKEARPYLFYKYGFDIVFEQMSAWIEDSIIEKSGSWYSYKGERIGQGLSQVSKYLREHPEICETIASEHKIKCNENEYEYDEGEVIDEKDTEIDPE